MRATPPDWTFATRLAFRFCVIYITLLCLTTQILPGLLPIPTLEFDPGSFAPLRAGVHWVAAHVLGVYVADVRSGSGDKTFDWVLAFCWLSLALLGALVWSALDRRRLEYRTLHKWFYLFVRFALASQMLVYGMVKVVPLQMPFPYLQKLLEPFGNFSPMGVLWWSIGAAPAYERFVGAAELPGGVLLFFPRTTMLGALVCLADTTEIFTLNMTYDVPVKLFSFHLWLMSLFLLAPELSRILRFFFSTAAVEPSTRPALFTTAKANRIALAAQLTFGLLLLGNNAYGAHVSWSTYGGGAPKSALYGIWNIDEVSTRADAAIPPELARWRRLIFERPTGMTVQLADDTFTGYNAAIDIAHASLTLKASGPKSAPANFIIQWPSRRELILHGTVDGRQLALKLHLLDRDKMQLISRGFHWIQEYPYNK